jgi:predicted enzyme related to lactoylglutathione lyase
VNYVSVTDAESSAARAAALGGTVVVPPTDIGEGGRMGVLADPQGAVVALWQPLGFAGAQVVNVPGAFTWNQLSTSDPEAAIAFYSELFGWTTEEVDGGDAPYWSFRNSANWLNGGVMSLPPGAPAPPHWLPYFASSDLARDEKRVAELGGSALTPIMPIPAGRLFVAQDDQGAAFGLFEGELEP